MEHEYTSQLICPHCDKAQSDAWEWADSDDEAMCGHCDMPFSYERRIEVTYTSRRKRDG